MFYKKFQDFKSAFPLSMAQIEIWREHVLFPDTPIHTVSAQTRINGALDVDVLHTALGLVWDRHIALRLTPVCDADMNDPVQIETARPDRFLHIHNVEGDIAEARASLLAKELGRRTIALDGGATWRFDLIRIAADQHIWVMSYHHINMDAWANGILMRDVSALYNDLLKGSSPTLDPAPSFMDSVSKDADFAQTELYKRNKDYWAALYTHMPDRMVNAGSSVLEGRAPGGTLERRLLVAGSELDGLRRLAIAQKTTLARLFMAAALMVFNRISGTRDCAFGMPVLNRPTARARATFGLFSLTTVPRVALNPDDHLELLLKKIDTAVRGAIRHHRYPLSRVNRELGLAAQRTMQLFDLNISYEKVDFGVLPFGDATASVPNVLLNGVERLPVELFVREYGDERIEVDFECALSAFDSDSATRLVSLYRRILEWMSGGGEGRLSSVALVDRAERDWLIVGLNATGRDYGDFAPVHRLFEALAQTQPDQPALRFEGEVLSYGEVNRRANLLARRLIRAGARPDMRVGVALERSAELVIALLAVMKAGGAYVPLDPELPHDRLSFMIEDAAAPIVLTRLGLLAQLPGHKGLTLCLDEAGRGTRRGADGSEAANPVVHVHPLNLAYVIYTSGSTGRPKGVMNSHEGLRNRLNWMQERFPLTAADRVLQKTPYTFDVSVWEFFWPLMTGACLVVARPGGHRDPDYLAHLLRREQVSVAHFVPSMLQSFMGHAPAAAALSACADLRFVMCSGEALPPALAQRFLDSAPAGAQLHNLYGPTEAAIDVTHWACLSPADEPMPIGHAIANTQLYVLDARLDPVPVGMAGDLWIGGVQLARGYLNRPGLTADSFIADPHARMPGARMYRTGDIARRRADGALIYMGRSDFQVKLRGFRIELGEIESVLLLHPDVRETAVILREDRPGDPHLVAYVVSAAGHVPDDLRETLARRLPEHMIPSFWVGLEHLPITANGKLDRKALPAPDLAGLAGASRPQGAEEEICCAVFAAILGREDVGAEDNFFGMGGHSLLAVQAANRLRRALEVDLPANALFAHPTPRALAKAIRETRMPMILKMEKRASMSVREATSAEKRLWILQQREPGNTAYNMAGVIDIAGELNSLALCQAIAAVQAHHPLLHSVFCEAERLKVQPQPELIRVPALDYFATVAASAKTEQDEAGRCFVLDRELPFRARVFQFASDHHRILCVFHHIIADADSLTVFAEDLNLAYTQICNDSHAKVELPVIGYDPLQAEMRIPKEFKALA